MPDHEAIYDETGSKLLVQALLATDDTSTLAAVNGLRRYVQRETLPVHDIKIFFASGPAGTWMRGVMSIVERANRNRLNAENGMVRYRKRLAVVETALRRFRSILKDVAGSDTKDHLLQWHMQNDVRIDDRDTIDDSDTLMARLLADIPTE